MSQTIQNSGLKHYQYLPILFLGGVPCYIVIITSYNIPRDPLIVVLRDASLEFGIFILGTAPLCNSYMKLIIWLYIALNMTPNTDCYRVGGGAGDACDKTIIGRMVASQGPGPNNLPLSKDL